MARVREASTTFGEHEQSHAEGGGTHQRHADARHARHPVPPRHDRVSRAVGEREYRRRRAERERGHDRGRRPDVLALRRLIEMLCDAADLDDDAADKVCRILLSKLWQRSLCVFAGPLRYERPERS